MRSTGVLLTLGLWLGLAAGSTATADLAVPGRHNQSYDTRIDFGPYADYTTRVHKVVEGDTLSALAQTHLGSAQRWQEIPALNPGLKADALPVGTLLLLPPSKTPLAADAAATADGPQHWWDVLTVNLPGHHLGHAQHGEDVRWGPYGCWLLAVRHDRLAALRQAAEDPKRDFVRWVEDLAAAGTPWIARTKEQVAHRSNTEESDPIWKIHVERKITAIGGGVITLEDLRTTYYGRDGKVLSKEEVAAAKSRWNVLLLALAAAAAAGLLLVMRRRAVHVRSAPAR